MGALFRAMSTNLLSPLGAFTTPRWSGSYSGSPLGWQGLAAPVSPNYTWRGSDLQSWVNWLLAEHSLTSVTASALPVWKLSVWWHAAGVHLCEFWLKFIGKACYFFLFPLRVVHFWGVKQVSSIKISQKLLILGSKCSIISYLGAPDFYTLELILLKVENKESFSHFPQPEFELATHFMSPGHIYNNLSVFH